MIGRSRTGIPSEYILDSNESRAMRRWVEVRVEAASSRRKMAVAIGPMARAGYLDVS